MSGGSLGYFCYALEDRADDLAKERQRFTTNNLAADMKNTGLLLWPNTYS